MNKTRLGCASFLTATALVLFRSWFAERQARRVWVSGAGANNNSCGRTTPCRTFAGAIGKVAAGVKLTCSTQAAMEGSSSARL
jgi:hypothetical protein